jgi:hypothetical protein
LELSRKLAARLQRWSSACPPRGPYDKQPCAIAKTELRGISVQQLEDLRQVVQPVVGKVDLDVFVDAEKCHKAKTLDWTEVNLYHINDNFVMPLTRKSRCSFVELIATDKQKPTWFISHWWGTPFRMTMDLLNFHAKQREVGEKFYWMCTFANNQHDLSELGGGIEDTPFVKVLRDPQCEGTVVLLNPDCTPFERMWCVLELSVSTKNASDKTPPHLYDIAAWILARTQYWDGKPEPGDIPALQLDNGNGTTSDTVEAGVKGFFPLDVARKGIEIDIEAAGASRETDKIGIPGTLQAMPPIRTRRTTP